MFGRKRRIDIQRSVGPFFRADGYESVHQRQRVPDPGAGNYSWETLQMAQYPPSGPTVAIREQVRSIAPQAFVPNQAVTVAGIATTSGQLVHQPLSNGQQDIINSFMSPLNNAGPNTP